MTILRSTPRFKGNWNVIALTATDDDLGTEGAVIERYAYTPYGEFIVIAGDSGDGQLGNVLMTSTVGNPFTHQGLHFDHEKGMYQNRYREYAPNLQRFVQRDPIGYTDALSRYAYQGALPYRRDPAGLTFEASVSNEVEATTGYFATCCCPDGRIALARGTCTCRQGGPIAINLGLSDSWFGLVVSEAAEACDYESCLYGCRGGWHGQVWHLEECMEGYIETILGFGTMVTCDCW